MADDRKGMNALEDAAKNAGPKTDEAKPESGKKAGKAKKPGRSAKSKYIVIVMLLIVAGLCAAGYCVFGKKYIGNLLGKKTFVNASASTPKKEAVGPILQLDPFVFNLSGNQSKYAKISLGIEVKDAKAMEETKKMIPLLRDKVLSIFGTKAPEVLMDVSQRESIKKEVRASLTAIFKNEDDLKAVYITDIIIQ